MKYEIGETVFLLNTEFKPACTAVVRDYNNTSLLYEVEYKYGNSKPAETIWVPQERLMLSIGTVSKK